ncbi:GTPase of the mitochondrial inner membrane that associates with the large ribosomal subunit [Emmonsiellopsis sp. PD_33]|nr:GTPase of the mitochondrial inner membrane that associates with the large ribosomal subunit [Emmonsiellopsis sp. PD_33]
MSRLFSTSVAFSNGKRISQWPGEREKVGVNSSLRLSGTSAHKKHFLPFYLLLPAHWQVLTGNATLPNRFKTLLFSSDHFLNRSPRPLRLRHKSEDELKHQCATAAVDADAISLPVFIGSRGKFDFCDIHSQDTTDINHLNPAPSDYSRSIFQDRCTLTMHAGSGGHGCVSFLREKYIEDGPANGGDGGSGGNIFIQAVEGQTSLHKLARRGIIKAGHGRSGQGKSQGGQRGKDILLQVPVGTIIREISRHDPVSDEEQRLAELIREMGKEEGMRAASERRERWVLHPGASASDFLLTEFPILPPPRRSAIAATQPKAPIYLDLSEHMEDPILLAAGAVGGYGNPHFVSKTITKPRFATRGEKGLMLELEFELKLLADVGLVGLPNAGKSTLLRSITNSRTRIGNWAFTTLSPKIGTVVLDNHSGRPLVEPKPGHAPRTNFSIADIPGLIEGAHMDKGLGLGFLRHVERAGILAFVIDLSAGDAVAALKGLWRELDAYNSLRERELNLETEQRLVTWLPLDGSSPTQDDNEFGVRHLTPPTLTPSKRDVSAKNLPPMYTKPWLVVGTKADLPGTQENFLALRSYLNEVENGTVEHPCCQKNAWRGKLFSIPVSAINAHGVNTIPERVVRLLDGHY